VIADELWRSRFQQIRCRFDQWCIGDGSQLAIPDGQ
jgi:hypothetical protein